MMVSSSDDGFERLFGWRRGAGRRDSDSCERDLPQRLLDAAHAAGPADTLLMHLIATEHLRLGEVLALRAGDLDCASDVVAMRMNTKMGERECAVHGAPALAAQALLRGRRRTARLLYSDERDPWTHKYAAQQLLTHARAAGLAVSSVHELRRTIEGRHLDAERSDGRRRWSS